MRKCFIISWPYWMLPTLAWTIPRFAGAYRHGGKTNVLFVDGSVRPLGWPEIWRYIVSRGGAWNSILWE